MSIDLISNSNLSKNTNSNANNLANTSNIESQIALRVEKMNKLKEFGFDPFPVVSKRDFSIGFVKFWFNFTHKFDLSQLQTDDSNYLLEHYLAQALFPQSLLETMEEKLHIRNTARQMGIDPDEKDDFDETKIDEKLINTIRDLFPDLLKKSKEEKEKLLAGYLLDISDDDESTAENLVVQLVPNQRITLVGRIKDKRGSGKIAFANLEDESCPEGFQVIFKKDLLENTRNKFVAIFSPETITQKLLKK